MLSRLLELPAYLGFEFTLFFRGRGRRNAHGAVGLKFKIEKHIQLRDIVRRMFGGGESLFQRVELRAQQRRIAQLIVQSINLHLRLGQLLRKLLAIVLRVRRIGSGLDDISFFGPQFRVQSFDLG